MLLSYLRRERRLMPQDLVSDREPDDREPDGSGPAPEDDGEGTGQGLYVCLPAEQLTLAGFAQGGGADTMAPGPLLATVVHAVTGQDGAGLAGASRRTCSRFSPIGSRSIMRTPTRSAPA